jgi:hypothetical protein
MCGTTFPSVEADMCGIITKVAIHNYFSCSLLTTMSSQHFCDQPVSRNELNKRREAFERQRIFLGMRLKEAFHCRTLAALRWHHLTTDSSSLSKYNLGMIDIEGSPFLSLLGSKAAEFSCQFLQQPLLLPLVKAAVYLFDIVSPSYSQRLNLSSRLTLCVVD